MVKKTEYRRKREGRTNYSKRLRLLLGDKPRFVVRKSLQNMLVQVVNYETNSDKVVITAHSNELKKLGWKSNTSNIPAAYLVGYLAGKKMLAKGIKEAVVDVGLQAKGQRIFAAVKGALDAGITIPHNKKIMPKEDRLGKHISDTINKAVQTIKEKIK